MFSRPVAAWNIIDGICLSPTSITYKRSKGKVKGEKTPAIRVGQAAAEPQKVEQMNTGFNLFFTLVASHQCHTKRGCQE